MFTSFYRKLQLMVFSFIKGREGVTTVEYAVLAVTLMAIVAAVFNSSSGPLYDLMVQAKDSLVAAIADNTGS